MKRRKYRSRSKKNPISHRAAVRRAKKAARTRKRHKAEKRASSRRSAGKRRSGARRTHHRKSPKRVRAARKAARTRKRRYGQVSKREHEEYLKGGYGYEARRKRGRRRKKNPVAAAAEVPRRRKHKRKSGRRRARHLIRASKSRKRGRRHSVKGHYRKGGRGRRRSYVRRHMSHEEARRRRKHGRRSRARETRRHRNRRGHRRNPIQGPVEFFMSVLGVATGYVLASGADRYFSTAPVSGSGAQEQPPAGTIYNSEAVALPIWSSWQRMLAGAASVGVPLVIAGFLRNPAGKSFFQLAGFGALARTAGKAADDGLAMVAMKMTTPNPTLVRLYAPEIAAAAKLASVIPPNALPAAPTATFAGLPAHRRVGRVGQMDPSGLSTTDANGNPFVLDMNGNVITQIMQSGGTCPSGWSMIPNSEYCGQLAPTPPPPTPPPPPMSPPPPASPPPTMSPPCPPPLPPPPMPPSVPLPPPSIQNDCQPCAPVVNPIPPATGPTVGPFNPLYACPDGAC